MNIQFFYFFVLPSFHSPFLSRDIVEFPLVVCLFPGIVSNYFYYYDRSRFIRASPSNWDMFRFKPVFRILFFSQ
jgi:hypothetical protein